jgi:hypothetical protein
MLKYSSLKLVQLSDWDELVIKTYGKKYSLQQDYCRSRGVFFISIPSDLSEDESMNDSIPEVVNGKEMGVKFDVWLKRDVAQPIPNQTDDYQLDLFWGRNFYPDVHTVANDLYKKGLIKKGDYGIDIDW